MQTPSRPLATWNPVRGAWESTQTALCGHWELFSATWPTSGSMRSGSAFQPPTPAPRTAGSASSSSPGRETLLPTPDAAVFNDGQSVEAWQIRKAREKEKGYNGNGGGTPLAMQVRLLMPTPRASDGEKGGPNQRGSSGDLMLPSAVHSLLPTPTASDRFGAGEHGEGGQELESGDAS